MTTLPSRAHFSTFEESTDEDWALIAPQDDIVQSYVPGRVMSLLCELGIDYGGYPVTRLEHSLQAATRAEHDGRDEEYLLCAVLHDVGDVLGPFDHAAIAAGILRPFVSEANHWMVEHHAVFQGAYYWDHIGLDPNTKLRYRGSPYYEYTEEFCAKYDQVSFDAEYASAPLEHFEPLIRARLVTSIPAAGSDRQGGAVHEARSR